MPGYATELTPAAGKLEALKAMMSEVNKRVKANEPGTLLYPWYINKKQMMCYLFETSAGKEAFLAHLANIEPVLPELIATAPITGWKFYGNLSEKGK